MIRTASSEIAKAVRSPEIAQRFLQLGIDPVGSTPDAYGELIRAAYDRFGVVVKATGTRAE